MDAMFAPMVRSNYKPADEFARARLALFDRAMTNLNDLETERQVANYIVAGLESETEVA